ncbi:MAG: tetraacyldisaccharide 4'-kinase [Planctomycetes bacterium]|nr:tetraacyldisaccharide 4'-kinase [Planctomycetota bacterium]
MGSDSFLRRAMRGEHGWLLTGTRMALRIAAACYGVGVRLRNRRYDRSPAAIELPVPVISVGNITAGGTGKTPLVIALTRGLIERGRRVSVVSRGYGAKRGAASDEMMLISRAVPGAVCLADPDRVAAARRAIDTAGVDCVIADDAFQHRRLARDLDIVVIDATCPFGYGHLLPRGLLREPLSGLDRADVIVISRANLVDLTALALIDEQLDRWAPNRPRLKSCHAPRGFFRLDGSPGDIEPGDIRRALVTAAIGNPDSFARTLGDLGVCIAATHWWPDHHVYRAHDIQFLGDQCRLHSADCLLITEKDAVKVAPLVERQLPCPIYALRVEIDFVGDDGRMLWDRIDELLRGADSQCL